MVNTVLKDVQLLKPCTYKNWTEVYKCTLYVLYFVVLRVLCLLCVLCMLCVLRCAVCCVLCYIMLCYVILCYIVILYYIILYYIILYYIVHSKLEQLRPLYIFHVEEFSTFLPLARVQSLSNSFI